MTKSLVTKFQLIKSWVTLSKVGKNERINGIYKNSDQLPKLGILLLEFHCIKISYSDSAVGISVILDFFAKDSVTSSNKVIEILLLLFQ